MRAPVLVLLLSLSLSVGAACGNPEADLARRTTEATYDPSTGRLSRLTGDLNKNGVVDTWTYLDGTTVLRSESDLDEDSVIDRWEYNFPDGKVERVGLSLRKTGRPDMWAYPDPDNPTMPLRKEFVGLKHETRIVRWEHYQGGVLRRVEADTDENGRIDRWEVHEATEQTVEVDRTGDGRPDERTTYDATGKVLRREVVR
jgi:hypothetical protein